MKELQFPDSIQKLAGFRTWATSEHGPDEGLRASFLADEVILDMSPEEINSHNPIKTEITSVLAQFVKRQQLRRFYSDRTFCTNEEATISIEPDAVFVLWSSIEANRVQLLPHHEEGEHRHFRLTRERDPVNLWEYTLDVKSIRK